MDSSYYQTHLKYLYDSTGNETPVYNVDNLLYNYTSKSTFTNNITPSEFFQNITNVSIYNEQPSDVLGRINSEDNINLPILDTTNNNFSETATMSSVRINITRAGKMDTETILTGIASQIEFNNKIFITSSTSTEGLKDITKSHIAFDQYMLGIITSVCQPCFIQAIRRLPYNIPPNAPQNLINAINDISSGNINSLTGLFTTVSTQVKKNIKDIIIPLPNIRTDIMNDFNNKTSSFNRPTYYELRSKIANELIIKEPILIGNESDDFTLLYINKILADIIIKTCYPMIHYIFIDSLMTRYAGKGDFVNIRIALLAKIFFTYYFVDYIYQNIYTVDSVIQSDSAKKLMYNSLFTQINSNLNAYLTNINNIDIGTTVGKDALADIIKSLHTLSNNVVQKSQQINNIQNQITENQLALRSVIPNVDSQRKRCIWKKYEFWINLIILLTVVLVSAVLLFFNKPKYVFYIAVVTIINVIIIVFIKIINSFLKK
jgi:hypothetical protein